jgi:hypothetical protein
VLRARRALQARRKTSAAELRQVMAGGLAAFGRGRS